MSPSGVSKSVSCQCITTVLPLAIHLLTTCNPHFWPKTAL